MSDQHMNEFRRWLERDLARFGKIEDHVEFDRIEADVRNGDTALRVRIWTDLHCYSISVRAPRSRKVPMEAGNIERRKLTVSELETLINSETKFIHLGPDGFAEIQEAKWELDDGYLGCIASSRKPRAGEKHTRGNDLADGPLTEETWRRILADIVSYEMVRVHRPKPTDTRAQAGGFGSGVADVAAAARGDVPGFGLDLHLNKPADSE